MLKKDLNKMKLKKIYRPSFVGTNEFVEYYQDELGRTQGKKIYYYNNGRTEILYYIDDKIYEDLEEYKKQLVKQRYEHN